jgi:hypothetical protein
MKKYISILLFLLLLSSGIGFVSFLYFRDKAVIITVLDSQTRQPITQAIVATESVPLVPANETHRAYEINLAGNSLGVIPQMQLKATAPGYLPHEISVLVPWWRKQHEIKVSLEPTQIAGRVTDALTGDPVSATIYVSDSQTPPERAEPVVTNNEGYFEVLRLEPPISLRVEALGYKTWQTQLASAELYTDTLPLTLDINLAPQDIIGQVNDAWTGDPLPAIVHLTDNQSSSGQSRQVIVDNEGYFEAIRVEPPVVLQVEAPGYEVWQTKLDSLELVTGNPAYRLVIDLIPRTTTGVLRTVDTNEPLGGLTLSAGSGDRKQTTTTDATGLFEFHRLQPGDLLTIQAPAGYLPAEIIFNNEPELNLSLQPRQVTITVRDSFIGGPVTGVNLAFDQTLTATTNAQGQATFSRIPASGQISATQPGYHSVALDYQDSNSIEVIMTPSALQGVVRGGDTGQPLPQATLYLNNTILRADDEGHFVVEGLPATPEQIMLKSAGYHRAYAQLSQTGIFTDYTPPFSGVEGRWLDTAPCSQAPTQPGPPCLDLILEPFQAKAIYVPFHYLRKREAIIRYLDFIQATELNAIVVDVKGDFGFVGWESEVELVEMVDADKEWNDTWMSLDELIAEARKRNIYTIARFVVFKDDPLAHGKPELAAVREDGTVWIDDEELGWVNPFKEEVWDYNIALAKEVATFGFDELNFDYIRFPSDGDVGAIVYEEENTLETRTAAMGEFMHRLTDALRPYGIFVSADVFGLTIWVKPESDMKIGQRVIDIAPYVDYLAPMVYPSTFIPGNLGYDNPSAEPYGIVYRSQHQAEERVPPYVKVRPWLQGYWYSLDEMRKLKQAAIDARSTGWSWWNAGGKYDSDLFEPADKQ